MTVEDLRKLKIKTPDPAACAKAKEHWDRIAKPIDGLGDLEELICRIAAIRGTSDPDLARKVLVVLCADNGIVEEGVSQTGKKVTFDVATLLGQGKSTVCTMAKGYDTDILTYDVGIDSHRVPEGVIDRKIARGTRNFLKEPAMTEEECLEAVDTGIRIAEQCFLQGYDIIATGEMGIGNTTTSTALLCAITGFKPAGIVGKGAGLTEEGLKRKLWVIEEGLDLHFGKGSGEDLMPDEKVLGALAKVGGLDIAALTGLYIGGALYGIPVVIDGLISAVAALIAEELKEGCRHFMIASHNGREKGMTPILERLGLKAVLHADLALGEGTGALLLLPLLDMALSLYRYGTVFDETGIGRYERFEG